MGLGCFSRRNEAGGELDIAFRLLWGLTKVAVLSPLIQPVSLLALREVADPSIAQMALGAVAFSAVLYLDFSGYSDMAIGMGRMVGFHYLENFRFPYIARSASEFWRRWHMSLGSFFRDYVYIPMGGNRKHVYLNLFVVWFLTGMWHGASWNFILWGLYFGVLIALERLFLGKLLEKMGAIFGHIYLLFAAIMGWALFYYTDIHRLGKFVSVLFGNSGKTGFNLDLQLTFMANASWFLFALLFCLPIKPAIDTWLDRRSLAIRTVAAGGEVVLNAGMFLVAIALLVGKSYNPFLYFRF
jgi:alginate O-acetyltransferase complex protein AlgI